MYMYVCMYVLRVYMYVYACMYMYVRTYMLRPN